VFDQRQQRVEDLGRHRDYAAILTQGPLGRIKDEGTESVLFSQKPGF